ncbi:MAG: GyrI-like domain-containing protein [Candidatus Adiutrix sp.]|jgi:AraC family transcriptional regulator|nr:GyrI-like domain-containing protein [Candidatus Adiutrix sp.]
MSKYDVNIVDYPDKSLAGIKIRTSKEKAGIDCPAIWQELQARLSEISPDCGNDSYGLSVMLNDNEFDYWATIEFDPARPVPAGLETIEIPAGSYAKITAPNLDKLSEAYTFIYTDWFENQTSYSYRAEAPCFEIYPSGWTVVAPLEIFMPLAKK